MQLIIVQIFHIPSHLLCDWRKDLGRTSKGPHPLSYDIRLLYARLRLQLQTIRTFKPFRILLKCMKSCVARESGTWDDNINEFNENQTLSILEKAFTNPGGKESSYKITQELVECSRKCKKDFLI
jgi:hypothetical protein